METIAIGAQEGLDEIRASIERHLHDELDTSGVRVRLQEVERGKWHFLGCRLQPVVSVAGGLEGAAEAAALARRTIAGALGEVICLHWEPRMMRRLIRTYYDYFDEEEQGRIFKSARGQLTRRDAGRGSGISRRARVQARLQEYLSASNNLILDGFVTFRLKDYIEELEDAVDRAVDDYLLEREYEEFVHLLRHFIESQAPRVDTAQVLRMSDGRFQLVNADGGDLSVRALSGLDAGVDGPYVNGEDVLISALVTMAPRNICLHRLSRIRDLKDAVETIRRVFGSRVRLCTGCTLCRKRKAVAAGATGEALRQGGR